MGRTPARAGRSGRREASAIQGRSGAQVALLQSPIPRNAGPRWPAALACGSAMRVEKTLAFGYSMDGKSNRTNTTERPAMPLKVKTLLHRIQPCTGFVYQEVSLQDTPPGRLRSNVRLQPHRGLRGQGAEGRRPAPGYDRLPERWWLFGPLWGIVTGFLYAPRRVACSAHGVGVEPIRRDWQWQKPDFPNSLLRAIGLRRACPLEGR